MFMKRNDSREIGEHAFRVFCIVMLTVFALIAIAPVILIFISSFSEEKELLAKGYSYFPKAWSLDAYAAIFSQRDSIFSAYGMTIIVTAIGTIINVIMTILFAYPLSRKDFKYRNILSFFVFFTMLFNGGIVPQYIMYTRYLGIKNTILALIIPNRLLGAFNIFLVRNYYSNSIPNALVEAAKIDGANELQVFGQIMVPLAKPVIATISLFVGLAYWNDWVNGLYYISKSNLFTLQLLLKKLLDNIQLLASGRATAALGTQYTIPTTSYRMALAVIGVVPILIIYPFVQQYLVRGTVIGAIKG